MKKTPQRPAAPMVEHRTYDRMRIAYDPNEFEIVALANLLLKFGPTGYWNMQFHVIRQRGAIIDQRFCETVIGLVYGMFNIFRNYAQ